jgi:hypothetical protein
VFELNLYTVAYLDTAWPSQLASLHGLFDLGFAVLMLVGTMRGREDWRLKPSRAMTFHSVSLLVIGGYFVAMIAVAQWLAYAGGDYALVAVWFCHPRHGGGSADLPSRRLRAWIGSPSSSTSSSTATTTAPNGCVSPRRSAARPTRRRR